MAAPESIKAGFMKERDVFAEHGILYIAPLVSMNDPLVVSNQLHEALQDALSLNLEETKAAVAAGFAALDGFNRTMQEKGREILS